MRVSKLGLVALVAVFLVGAGVAAAPPDFSGTWFGTLEVTAGPGAGEVMPVSIELERQGSALSGILVVPGFPPLTFDGELLGQSPASERGLGPRRRDLSVEIIGSEPVSESEPCAPTMLAGTGTADRIEGVIAFTASGIAARCNFAAGTVVVTRLP